MDTIITLSLIILTSLIIFFPKVGLYSLIINTKEKRQREQVEDALKYLLDKQYEGDVTSRDSLGGALRLSQTHTNHLIRTMESQGLIDSKGSKLVLTPSGEQWAVQILRAHRLWEKYLAVEANMPLEKIHMEAHRREHKSSVAQINQIEADLGFPKFDPHGDPIPDRSGQITGTFKTSLTDWPMDKIAEIIEIEDEPTIAFQQIMASGIRLGMTIRLLNRDQKRLILSDGNQEFTLAPVVASNIMVASPVHEPLPIELLPLSKLKNGEKAEVVQFDETVQGLTRRRFLDLGLTPGALIYPELENFFREPRAYRIRGTLIALREDQASRIIVKPIA